MSNGRTIVFFDLMTTGFGTDRCHIIQLSAVCGKRKFNEFILPHIPITHHASRVTGFTISHGWLYHHGEKMDTIPLFDALTYFIDFLYSIRCRVILAAHSAKRFDAPVLIRVLKRFSLWHDFQQVVSGFLDTLPLSRSLFPHLCSHSLPKLVYYFLGDAYTTDDALKNAAMLKKLFNKWNPNRWHISNSEFYY